MFHSFLCNCPKKEEKNKIFKFLNVVSKQNFYISLSEFLCFYVLHYKEDLNLNLIKKLLEMNNITECKIDINNLRLFDIYIDDFDTLIELLNLDSTEYKKDLFDNIYLSNESFKKILIYYNKVDYYNILDKIIFYYTYYQTIKENNNIEDEKIIKYDIQKKLDMIIKKLNIN